MEPRPLTLENVVGFKLDDLAKFRQATDCCRAEAEKAIAAVTLPIQERLGELDAEKTALTAPYEAEIASIEAACQLRLNDLAMTIKELEAEIVANALVLGKTVHGAELMAVWSRGRTTWDSEALKGYAVADPKIFAFMKVGEPSVKIQAIKK